MPFPERSAQPLTLKIAQQQLDECWRIIDSFRTLHEEHEQLKEKHAALEQRLDEVVSQLKTSSRNSSKPPSSDHPEQKAKRPRQRQRSSRKQGAQPGHPKHERAVLPEDQVIISSVIILLDVVIVEGLSLMKPNPITGTRCGIFHR